MRITQTNTRTSRRKNVAVGFVGAVSRDREQGRIRLQMIIPGVPGKDDVAFHVELDAAEVESILSLRAQST